MMETDDKLVKMWFTDNKREVEDNGFTRRVMHHLPDRNFKLFNVLRFLFIGIALVLFIAFDGVIVLVKLCREIFVALVQTNVTTFDYKALIVAAAVLLFIGIQKLYSME